MKKLILISMLSILMLFLTGCECEHEWSDASCSEPQTCSLCGNTQGMALGHTVDKWVSVSDSTCTENGIEEGVCIACHEKVTRNTEVAPHTEGEWEITREATENISGEKSIRCTVCGQVLKTDTFTLTAEEIRDRYIESCILCSYDSIAQSPDEYNGTHAMFYG